MIAKKQSSAKQKPTPAQEKLSRGESVEVARSRGESASGEALPQGWASVRLEELGMGRSKSVDPSKSPDTQFELWSVPTFPTGEPEIQTGSDIGSTKQAVEPGDVLLCKINPRINRVWVVEPKQELEQIASSEWIIFRNNEVDPYFLMHRLREPAFREDLCEEVSGVGGSLTRARPQVVKNIEISLPPQAEQSRIVSAIESLQERSSRARVLLSEVGPLIRQLRQSVLRDAFSGKLTAHWRAKQNSSLREPTALAAVGPSKTRDAGAELEVENRERQGHDRLGRRSAKGRLASGGSPESAGATYEPASALLHRIRIERKNRWEAEQLALYEAKGKHPPQNWQDKYEEPEPVDDSDLPELPEGWCWCRAEEVCEYITKGTTPPKDRMTQDSGNVRFLKVGNLTFTGALNFDKENAYIDNETHNTGVYARSRIHPGDVLMNLVGPPLGKVSLIPEELKQSNVNQAIAIFRPIEGISPRYLTLVRATRDSHASSRGRVVTSDHQNARSRVPPRSARP